MLTNQTLTLAIEALESQRKRLVEMESIHDYLNGVGYTAQQLDIADTAITELKAAQAAGEWVGVEYNDVINDDNGNQVRVVIGQGSVGGCVHLHIRKRVDGKWRHGGVTTLSDGYRLQKRVTIGSQAGEWERATVDNCQSLVTRAQFRRIETMGWALMRRAGSQAEDGDGK